MNINRRNFLKKLGAGAVGASTLLAACKSKNENIDDEATGQHEPVKGKMTMRTNANTGDEVSILGFGMMRLPMNENPESDTPYDQEMINKQVDYAIEHGVNYFDTSPAYNRGLSERCTGIALSRHKRDQYYIATKLSNFDASTWSADASQEMFANSLKELQVDYRRIR